ncbi:DUF397 domain-containing protein [Actinomadura madurae]|nr:DUF397 domain-containing protein [Actinomadura madurae]MCP9965111.1 DUF397 domain-containing protein [Actinomadura madurae]MCP9977603.1 DUF397 domain-containing protein [Actinomadura madurae]MCQ0013791.1 DUF397 domain-containing protein [Actinomadura madurae]
MLVHGQGNHHGDSSGGPCVDVGSLSGVVATEWQKSSRSDDTGGACIEVAALVAAVAVRDSKDPDGPKLVFGPDAWRAFAGHVKGGHLDLT